MKTIIFPVMLIALFTFSGIFPGGCSSLLAGNQDNQDSHRDNSSTVERRRESKQPLDYIQHQNVQEILVSERKDPRQTYDATDIDEMNRVLAINPATRHKLIETHSSKLVVSISEKGS